MFTLLDDDKLISSFRFQTVHNLILEQLAALEGSHSEPYSQFLGDEILWNKQYFKYLLTFYGHGNRELLSQEKQAYLIMRTVFHDLAQNRALRIDTKINHDKLLEILTLLSNMLDQIHNNNNLPAFISQT